MVKFRLTEEGLTYTRVLLACVGLFSAAPIGSEAYRLHTSSYYRYWSLHKEPSRLKGYYYVVDSVFAMSGNRASVQESDYRKWGLNVATGKPKSPVPDAETRQQLAKEILEEATLESLGAPLFVTPVKFQFKT